MYLYCHRCPAPRCSHTCPLYPGILALLQVLGISEALCTAQTVCYLQDLWHKQQTRHCFFLQSSREECGHSSKCLSISRCIRAMQPSSMGDQMSPVKPSLGDTPVTSIHYIYHPSHNICHGFYAEEYLLSTSMNQTDSWLVLTVYWRIRILQVPWKAQVRPIIDRYLAHFPRWFNTS